MEKKEGNASDKAAVVCPSTLYQVESPAKESKGEDQ